MKTTDEMLNGKNTFTKQDLKRFIKFREKKNTTSLHYFLSENGESKIFLSENGESKIFLSENGDDKEVLDVEIRIMDVEQNCYVLTKDTSSFDAIHIFFLPKPGIVVGYVPVRQKGDRYCSWGYKTSGTTTEKIYVYFKTSDSAYMAYFDAQYPGQSFFIKADSTEHYNSVEHLHRFIIYSRKGAQFNEAIPEK